MKELDLSQIRVQLDEIDSEMMRLFERRMELCRDVALYKIENGKPVFDPVREQEKIHNIKNAVEGEFFKQAAEELITQMMTISRRYQYQILNQNKGSALPRFKQVEAIPAKHVKVVYQGVEGAYSHQATLQYFGKDVDAYCIRTWEEAMQAVEQEEADYAVLPIENSSAGAVTDNYDLLLKYKNYIVGEIFLTVNHALLGTKDSSLEGIKKVYSHPQALMQCSEYLNSHLEWEQIKVENTAGAAKKVLIDNDPSKAAVAGQAAGEIYGLKVLAEAINYNKNNITRFIIVSKDPLYLKESSKISIYFELPHKSGSLYNMLGHFIYNGLNMMMIESRPIKGKNWEYGFFVDIEGNIGDCSIQNALNSVSHEASQLRILGNY